MDSPPSTYGWQIGVSHPTRMPSCYHPQSLGQGIFSQVSVIPFLHKEVSAFGSRGCLPLGPGGHPQKHPLDTHTPWTRTPLDA